jgi:hypothetical protein
MSMINSLTPTGMNLGQISEAALAICRIAKATNMTYLKTAERLVKVCTPNAEATVGSVTVVLDKKGCKSVKEMCQGLRDRNKECEDLASTASKALKQKELQVGRLQRVELCGAMNGKCDIRLVGSHGEKALSLKFGNDAPERLQARQWQTMHANYYSHGFDITDLERSYGRVYRQISTPAARRSNNAGDWSPQLRGGGNSYQTWEREELMRSVVNGSSKFDRRLCAESMADAFCRDEREVVMVDMKTGTVQCLNRNELVKKFNHALKHRRISFKTHCASRTNKLLCLIGGEVFLTICSTVASVKAPGPRRTALYVVRPQTSFTPNMEVLMKNAAVSQSARKKKRLGVR